MATQKYFRYRDFTINRSDEFPDGSPLLQVMFNDFRIFDANGDGNLDIVCGYSFWPLRDEAGVPIRYLIGDGKGGFSDATADFFGSNIPLADAVTGPTVADFNGDGVLDLYMSMHGYDEPPFPGAQDLLLLSDGQGGVFDATATHLPLQKDFTHWSTAADIDGDGDIDIFNDALGSDNVDGIDKSPHFLINDGNGVFTRSDLRLPAEIENGSSIYTSALLFDADADGDSDLFVGMSGPPDQPGQFSAILFNDGTGNFSFTANSALPTPTFGGKTVMLGVKETDLNGDGFLDLMAVASHSGEMDEQTVTDGPDRGATASQQAGSEHYVQALINNGDGSFFDDTANRLDVRATGNGRYIHMVDANGDGFEDLITQSSGASRIHLNDGAGRFISLPAGFLTMPSSWDQSIPGDFNNDGRLDFLLPKWIGEDQPGSGVLEHFTIATWKQPKDLTGGKGVDTLLGTGKGEKLTGGGGQDILFGAAGNDKLNGGKGADYLNGGIGNDIYFVDHAGDQVVEHAGGGKDTVRSSISYTLAVDVEKLVLTGKAGLSGFGNEQDNALTGNKGANDLSGGEGKDVLNGGRGNDALAGGAGADIFLFEKRSGVDLIADFEHGMDRIQIGGWKNIDTFGDIEKRIKQVGDDAVINFGKGDKLVIDNFSAADFTDADFVF